MVDVIRQGLEIDKNKEWADEDELWLATDRIISLSSNSHESNINTFLNNEEREKLFDYLEKTEGLKLSPNILEEIIDRLYGGSIFRWKIFHIINSKFSLTPEDNIKYKMKILSKISRKNLSDLLLEVDSFDDSTKNKIVEEDNISRTLILFAEELYKKWKEGDIYLWKAYLVSRRNDILTAIISLDKKVEHGVIIEEKYKKELGSNLSSLLISWEINLDNLVQIFQVIWNSQIEWLWSDFNRVLNNSIKNLLEQIENDKKQENNEQRITRLASIIEALSVSWYSDYRKYFELIVKFLAEKKKLHEIINLSKRLEWKTKEWKYDENSKLIIEELEKELVFFQDHKYNHIPNIMVFPLIHNFVKKWTILLFPDWKEKVIIDYDVVEKDVQEELKTYDIIVRYEDWKKCIFWKIESKESDVYYSGNSNPKYFIPELNDFVDFQSYLGLLKGIWTNFSRWKIALSMDLNIYKWKKSVKTREEVENNLVNTYEETYKILLEIYTDILEKHNRNEKLDFIELRKKYLSEIIQSKISPLQAWRIESWLFSVCRREDIINRYFLELKRTPKESVTKIFGVKEKYLEWKDEDFIFTRHLWIINISVRNENDLKLISKITKLPKWYHIWWQSLEFCNIPDLVWCITLSNENSKNLKKVIEHEQFHQFLTHIMAEYNWTKSGSVSIESFKDELITYMQEKSTSDNRFLAPPLDEKEFKYIVEDLLFAEDWSYNRLKINSTTSIKQMLIDSIYNNWIDENLTKEIENIYKNYKMEWLKLKSNFREFAKIANSTLDENWNVKLGLLAISLLKHWKYFQKDKNTK